MSKYLPVIGLEIHVELKTKTKMFCGCLNDADEKVPNTNVCPICMGHPGTLPVINKEAVRKVIMAGLALNCNIDRETFFERKNYFYPDLPKGYQISQYQRPFCYAGHLDVKVGDEVKKFNITRIHLEEDAGKLTHIHGSDYSLVDYNRAGLPLMELVTEADFQSGKEVKAFAEELKMIFQYLGISDADMEKGHMRVEVNISLRTETQARNGEYGTKVEIKNINSIKFASDAVDYEIERQSALLGAGEKVTAETRGWNEDKGESFSQRTKEEAQDYRYFPEPDLPPVRLDEQFIKEAQASIVELPSTRRERFMRYGLSADKIEIFVTNREMGNFYEEVASEIGTAAQDYHTRHGLKGDYPSEDSLPEKMHSLAANYMITEFPPIFEDLNVGMDTLKINAESFAELIVMIFHRELSSTNAKVVLREMAQTGLHPEQIIRDKDLGQVSDQGAIQEVVKKVIAANEKAVSDFKSGKEAPLKFLVGMVMKESKGKANPQMAEQMIRDLLS